MCMLAMEMCIAVKVASESHLKQPQFDNLNEV